MVGCSIEKEQKEKKGKNEGYMGKLGSKTKMTTAPW
jgi:hypothetical protein